MESNAFARYLSETSVENSKCVNGSAQIDALFSSLWNAGRCSPNSSFPASPISNKCVVNGDGCFDCLTVSDYIEWCAQDGSACNPSG